MNNTILQLYFIMGTTNVMSENPLTVLESALRGGITIFQLREKGNSALTGEKLVQFAQQCKALCQQYDVPFIINDDVQLALAVDADGVHIGQDDGDAEKVRKAIGPSKLLGVSTNTIDEAIAAHTVGANYIGVGPVFQTTSKADANAVVGLQHIAATTKQLPHLPAVGIGGITEHNAQDVIRAGAAGVAVISAIAAQSDVQTAAHVLKQQITRK